MIKSAAQIVLVAMAAFAIVFGLAAAPVPAAAAPAVMMAVNTADVTPCDHDSLPCPCCPKPCGDMMSCLAGGVAIADVRPAVVMATVRYRKINYAAATFADPPDRAGEPISRPPIV